MVREILLTLAALGTIALAASANAQAPEPDGPRHKAALAALRYFESVQGADFDALLRQLRRPAPPLAVRARVIETLPKEGALSPTTEEAAKLERIQPVLAVHGRDHDLEVRLVEAGGLALVGLHARTVLLITREALGLSTPEELLAIMAHEVGHDYLWDEYDAARRQGDPRRLQEVELLCDGIAVITLERLGLDPEHLVLAAMKLLRHNERVPGGRAIDAAYVPLNERVRFIRAVARLIKRRNSGKTRNTGDGRSGRREAVDPGVEPALQLVERSRTTARDGVVETLMSMHYRGER